MGNEKKRFTKSNCKTGYESHHGATTNVRGECELFVEFLVQVGVHQGSVLLPLFFAITVSVITEHARGLKNEILYAVDLFLMGESIQNLKEMFLKRNDASESKESKINLKKIKVMVSGSKGEVL